MANLHDKTSADVVNPHCPTSTVHWFGRWFGNGTGGVTFGSASAMPRSLPAPLIWLIPGGGRHPAAAPTHWTGSWRIRPLLSAELIEAARSRASGLNFALRIPPRICKIWTPSRANRIAANATVGNANW